MYVRAERSNGTGRQTHRRTEPTTVRRAPLVGTPDARVRRTVAAMSAVVRESLRDPAVVEVAASIVQGVDGRDQLAQIHALRSWLAGKVRFLADPLIDGDVIRTPALLLRQLRRDGMMQGDCDDVATLAATLGHAVGLRARFVTLAFFEPDAPYVHVYCELLDQVGRWHELDVTEPPERRAEMRPTRRAEYPALPELAGASTVSGLLGLAQLAYVVARVVSGVGALMDEVRRDV